MYQLDTTLASKADTIGAFINDTGKYVGKFIRAEKLVSANKGTHGIGFTFQADDNRECRFDIWTMRENNEPLQGLNQINALMACLKVRALTESVRNVKKWHDGSEQVMAATCFSELMDKPIGLLLRAEEYEKMQDGYATGEYAWRMGLFAIFQAGTELMASEILSRKTKPEQLGKVIGLLVDKPLKKKSGQTSNTGGQSNRPAAAPDFMDDDLPPF
jgi:hypothetical protein